jgi:X-Pro dipeptidyl-peptidase
MKKSLLSLLLHTAIILSFLYLPHYSWAQDSTTLTAPVIKDGMTQVIEEFSNPESWIRHDLWVETEFDTDGDGDPDRMHVAVTRPQQTE